MPVGRGAVRPHRVKPHENEALMGDSKGSREVASWAFHSPLIRMPPASMQPLLPLHAIPDLFAHLIHDVIQGPAGVDDFEA